MVERQYYAHAVQIELKHVRIDIDLSERIRQYRRYLDEAEVRKRGDLSTGRKWSQEREPTGELVCKLKVSQGYGWAEEWRDLPDRPLEQQINDILAGIAGGFEEIRLKREQEAEEASRRWELQRERDRQENERKRELIRYRRLMAKVEDWERARRIRDFVVAVGVLVPPDPTSEHRIRFDEWSRWALGHADRIDPLEDDSLYDREVTDSELWRLRD